MPASSRCATRRREAGGILLAAVVITMLVTLLVAGLAQETALRLEGRQRTRDGQVALVAAQAGVEAAVALAASGRDLTQATWIDTQRIGEATVTVTATDPRDGVLGAEPASGSSDADTVRVTAEARVGRIARRLRCDLLPLPHLALENVAFAQTSLGLYQVDVEGRVRANGNVGTIANTRLHGNITTLNGASIAAGLYDADTDTFFVSDSLLLPAADFRWFRTAGQQITLPYDRTIHNTYIGAGSNPYGTASPTGIYWIDAGGGDVYFQDCAIEACIAVLNAGAVFVTGWYGGTTKYYHHSPDPNHLPALLVQGDLTMRIEAGACAVTIPGQGEATLSSRLSGVFMCTGTLRGPQLDASQPIEVTGAFLAGQLYLLGPGTHIVHDPGLNDTPLVELTRPGLRPLSGTLEEP